MFNVSSVCSPNSSILILVFFSFSFLMSQSDGMGIELNGKGLQLKEGRRKRSTTGKGGRSELLSSSACEEGSRQRSKMGCRQQRNVGHSLALAPCACLCTQSASSFENVR